MKFSSRSTNSANESSRPGSKSEREESVGLHDTAQTPGTGTPPRGSSKKMFVFMTLIFVIILACVGFFGYTMMPKGVDASIATIDTKKYQSVTLSNGDVYFGKLTVLNADYLRLSEAYYLKVQNVSGEVSGTGDQNFSLEKLSSITYGPEDEMTIPRRQIAHFENLSGNSKVGQLMQQNAK